MGLVACCRRRARGSAAIAIQLKGEKGKRKEKCGEKVKGL